MNIVVQKYGGSSLASPNHIKRIAERVVETRKTGASVVVVVSAMGDTTDDLIALSRELGPEAPQREMDMLLSTGEQISCALLAIAIDNLGEAAISLTGPQVGIITDDTHMRAKILQIDPSRIRAELNRGKIAIIAGFQGLSREGMEITTLGRGGSDATAVALAASLDASVCEIYTDVAGVLTADPRVVPDARLLRDISYGEMLEMASLGALVLQPRSVEMASHYGVTLHVRSSFDASTGTYVRREKDVEQDMVVVGVAHDTNVAKVVITDVPDRPGAAGMLFGALAKEHINVDMIVQSTKQENTTDMLFTVTRDNLEQTLAVAERLAGELDATGVLHTLDLGKVSIVGAGMVSNPGVAAQMFEALSDNDINIQVISTSEIKVSCLIELDAVPRAVQAIHEAFDLGERVEAAKAAAPSLHSST